MYSGCLHPNLNGLYIYGDFTGCIGWRQCYVKLIREVLLNFIYRTLKENRTSGEWEHCRLCVGDSEVCPGADSLPTFIQAFGQDDGGEIYVLAINIPSQLSHLPATGAIYQITDPTRYVYAGLLKSYSFLA